LASVPQENDVVLLLSREGKRFFPRLKAGDQLQTHWGVVKHEDVLGRPYGSRVLSHRGHVFLLLRPSFHDRLMELRRASQIVYPKEIGLVLLKLDVGSGSRVVEVGTGSGVLTAAFARAVRPDGRVFSYEVREDAMRLAASNVRGLGLEAFVEFKCRDAALGIDEEEADACFVDVRDPRDVLEPVARSLAGGGFFGTILPTTNQVSQVLAALERAPFVDVEVVEIVLRRYKPVAERLRPEDRLTAHTGYLVFARKTEQGATEAAAP
jgi:tRNA (adenine57-N1/adenine58-N1)-methyltransferase